MPGRARGFAPIKPSKLRILCAPDSTVGLLSSPVSPIPSACSPSSSSTFSSISIDPPRLPLPWLWSCHKCHSHYPIGTTRRCLEDGHYFCAGTTVNPRNKRAMKHQACGSEFDYAGWKAYGEWRRDLKEIEKPDFANKMHLRHKDCSNHCDFPSECRWVAKRANVTASKLESHITNGSTATTTPTFDSILANNKVDLNNKISAVEGKEKSSDNTYLAKLVRSAERRTVRLATLLSPVEERNEEEKSNRSLRVRSPPPTTKLGPTLPAVMDFPEFKANIDRIQGTTAHSDAPLIVDESIEPVAMDLDYPCPSTEVLINDVHMESAQEIENARVASPLAERVENVSPQLSTHGFNFGFENERSPISPRRNAYD